LLKDQRDETSRWIAALYQFCPDDSKLRRAVSDGEIGGFQIPDDAAMTVAYHNVNARFRLRFGRVFGRQCS
jgi:hypothetical protein